MKNIIQHEECFRTTCCLSHVIMLLCSIHFILLWVLTTLHPLTYSKEAPAFLAYTSSPLLEEHGSYDINDIGN